MKRNFYLGVVALLATALAASADPVDLTLTPGSTVSDVPGATVGWGYNLANNTGYDLIVSATYFCDPGQDPMFTTCMPALGTYNDSLAQSFSNNSSVLADGGTLSQSFDPGNPTGSGIGNFVIDSSAVAGQSDAGSIVIFYDLWSSNPFTDQSAALIQGDTELAVAAEVDVAGTVSAVPEPHLPLIVGLCLAALIIRRVVSGKTAAN